MRNRPAQKKRTPKHVPRRNYFAWGSVHVSGAADHYKSHGNELKTVRARAMNWSLLVPRSRRTSLGMTDPAASSRPNIPQTTGILEACAAAFWVLRHVLTNLYKQTLSREVLVKGPRPLQSSGVKLLTRRGLGSSRCGSSKSTRARV